MTHNSGIFSESRCREISYPGGVKSPSWKTSIRQGFDTKDVWFKNLLWFQNHPVGKHLIYRLKTQTTLTFLQSPCRETSTPQSNDTKLFRVFRNTL